MVANSAAATPASSVGSAGRSIRGLAYRGAALGITGAPVAGAGNTIQKSCFVSFDWTPDFEAAVEYLTKCADGSLTTFFRGPQVKKGYTIACELSEFDMTEQALLVGGRTLTSNSNVVGYQPEALGTEPVPYGTSFEVWTPFVDGRGNIVNPATPYLQWVFPKVKFDVAQKKIENGPMQYSLTGYVYENPNWGTGPNGDWAFDSTRAWQVANVASLPSPLMDGVQGSAL